MEYYKLELLFNSFMEKQPEMSSFSSSELALICELLVFSFETNELRPYPITLDEYHVHFNRLFFIDLSDNNFVLLDVVIRATIISKHKIPKSLWQEKFDIFHFIH